MILVIFKEISGKDEFMIHHFIFNTNAYKVIVYITYGVTYMKVEIKHISNAYVMSQYKLELY